VRFIIDVSQIARVTGDGAACFHVAARTASSLAYKPMTSPGKHQFWSSQYKTPVEIAYVLCRDELPPPRKNTHKECVQRKDDDGVY